MVVRLYSLGYAPHGHRSQLSVYMSPNRTLEPCLSPCPLLSLWLYIRFLSLLVQRSLIHRVEWNSFLDLRCLSNYREGVYSIFHIVSKKKKEKKWRRRRIKWENEIKISPGKIKRNKSKRVCIYTYIHMLNFTLIIVICKALLNMHKNHLGDFCMLNNC